MDESPPICVPPHCYPHSTSEDDEDDEHRIQEDQQFIIQTKQGREDEYLDSYPEIMIMQDHTPDSEHEVENKQEDEEEDDDRPMCMPPICIPAAKSAPISIPCDEVEEED